MPSSSGPAHAGRAAARRSSDSETDRRMGRLRGGQDADEALSSCPKRGPPGMPKTVLVAGATGLVGYACLKHFARQPGCEVIALSRRRPDDTCGARWHPLDLADAQACAALAPQLAGVTHLVYAALHER